jgi:hypothetical protein
MFIISVIELFSQNLGVSFIFTRKMDISLSLSFCRVNTCAKSVLGLKLGMATEEDPIVQALEIGFKQKNHLDKVFTNLEVQRRAIMDITMEWKNFKDYFAYLDRSLQ